MTRSLRGSHHQQQRRTSEWCDVDWMKSLNTDDAVLSAPFHISCMVTRVQPSTAVGVCNIIFTVGRCRHFVENRRRWLDEAGWRGWWSVARRLIVPKWNTNCHLDEAPAGQVNGSPATSLTRPLLSLYPTDTMFYQDSDRPKFGKTDVRNWLNNFMSVLFCIRFCVFDGCKL